MKRFLLLSLVVMLGWPVWADTSSCLKSDFWKTLGGDDLFPFAPTFDPTREFDGQIWIPEKKEIWSLQTTTSGLIYIEAIGLARTFRTGTALWDNTSRSLIGAFNISFRSERFEMDLQQSVLRIQNDNRCIQTRFEIVNLNPKFLRWP